MKRKTKDLKTKNGEYKGVWEDMGRARGLEEGEKQKKSRAQYLRNMGE